MEYVEGQPLERMLEKGSMPFSRACAWIADIAMALHLAHRKGIIHGDVKPANILITDDGKVKLTDFGMARLASRDAKDTPLLGTPAYWCPEQIMGKAQDARSDIFSLGVVFYEMVTGKRPFDADSLQGVCQKVMSATPLPPSQINSSLPVGLNELVGSCLEKDPARRRSSAEDWGWICIRSRGGGLEPDKRCGDTAGLVAESGGAVLAIGVVVRFPRTSTD